MLCVQPIRAIHFSDPGCPWAYSARPYHARLRWRFGGQLDWRLVLIGLTESAEQYVARGYTPQRSAKGYRVFAERFGMPFAYEPKTAVSATSPACRALVAVRLDAPDHLEAAFCALQTMQFTSTGRLEDPAALRGALATVEGLDADGVVARVEDDDVWAAYEADRALARAAAGSPTAAQRRTATSDGPVRYTAPSVIFEHADGRTVEVGGFQPFESYDTALANLEPGLERRPEPADAAAALAAFPEGLVTAELAELLRADLGPRDVDGTRSQLDALAADGVLVREPLGNDARWRLSRVHAAAS